MSFIKRWLLRRMAEKQLAPLGEWIRKLKKEGATMTGWRTLLINGGLAAATAGLTFLAGVNLGDYGITGTTATIALTVINIILRFLTTTPVGVKPLPEAEKRSFVG